jgi:hypothetical protein
MAANFGVGLVIGATVASTVASAFGTVEQKIQSNGRIVGGLTAWIYEKGRYRTAVRTTPRLTHCI